MQVLEGLRSLLHQAASVDQRDIHERPRAEAGTQTNPPASVSGRTSDATLFAQRFEPPPRSLFTHLAQASFGAPSQQPAAQKQRNSDTAGTLDSQACPLLIFQPID